MAGEAPIIVGGCHRSGTSVVRRLLNGHSAIHCGPEVSFFRDFYGDFSSDPLQHLRFTQSARALLAEDDLLDVLGSAFVALHQRAAARHGKRRWADKAPENVLYLGQWRRLLHGRLTFIHVVRNPLDTLVSMREAQFPLTIPSGLDAQIAMYQRYTEAGLNHLERAPESSYLLVYERLVAHSEAELTRLMRFLGEDMEAAQWLLDDHKHGSGLEDPKVVETTEIHAKSVGRWRDELDDDQVDLVNERTADLRDRVRTLAGTLEWPT